MSSFSVKQTGVAARLLDGINTKARAKAASQAINKIAARGRTQLARRALQDVNLPPSYVAPASKRLYVSKTASPASLEAVITARRRQTSLSRFVVGTARPGVKAPVRVNVGSKGPQDLERAFLIRLRSGGELTDSLFNVGLAMRLPKGERPSASSAAKEIAPGLFLLYGPSLAQLIDNAAGTGLGLDIAPDLELDLLREFSRLLELNLA